MNHYENIPEELQKLAQWVCTRNDSKLPMQSFQNDLASSIDPKTWSNFSTALKAVEKGNYDYCGFVFNDNGIVGIDIDIGYDDDGFMSQTASDIIGKCRSYTEKSKSGRGFHVLVKGSLPFRGRNNLAGVEIYKEARYFIMTGNTLLYKTIVENQEAIDYIIEKYFPNTRENRQQKESVSRIYSPIWEMPEDGRVKLRPVYPRIPNGCRNICLTSLAGILHKQGYRKKHIYDELLYANATACDPPLHNAEIQSICNSVTKYKR